MKPPPGAQINWEHPFSNGLLMCVPFSEGRWNISPSANGGNNPAILYGAAPVRILAQGASSAPTWISNLEGYGVACVGGGTDFVDLGPDFIPAGDTTICIVRRKTDTTARNSTLFGISGGAAGNRCGCHFPFGDGIIYFDFGGFAGANRLTISGVTFTTNVERLVFTAGRNGSYIWRDSVLLGSQGTAITRTPSTALAWGLNEGNGGSVSDANQYNYCAVIARQWDDQMIRWWMEEPYANLYPPPPSPKIVDFGTGISATFPALSVAM